jgi:uncharacterized cupin superfamily protein
MSEIRVEKNPSQDRLKELGVYRWPIWEKEKSEFPWTYGETETCYFLEGEVTVTPKGGQPTRVGKGDLVTFPSGMSCVWQVHQPVRKHYRFG